ncbi:hypothetical protein N3K66_001630 [Trichothecium roseum]|uniref:Uncharacterized protein n=1 Tax=Trichothecium roseum TaxID=47278 RepID=A0ACC0V814_9HYPO|nr:hypothetical protein N3K66_001630 [Trichothecium roseum]
MAPPTDSLQVASRSNNKSADFEPCIFPAFDVGEDDQAEYVSFHGRLRSTLASDDVSQRSEILCAAWGILLGCFTGLESVCFGYDTQGLKNHNNDNITTNAPQNVGNFTKVANLHVSPDRKVQSVLAESSSSSNMVLLSESETKTLFNTKLSVHNQTSGKNNKKSRAQAQAQAQAGSASWCKIHIFVDTSTLDIVFSWTPSFMTRDQAENISSTYEKIINEMINFPQATIAELDYFSERNWSQISKWNSNTKSSVQKCIHQAISEQRDLHPESEAVCAWDGSFTYHELMSLSDRLASRLLASGVGPEVFVPICFDKSRWTIVAMLAVLKAGGIFVPLDPTHPIPRLQALAHKVGAKTILCSRQHLGLLETVAGELIPVDGHAFTDLPKSSSRVSNGSWDNGAYMIFTSGTTGEPKGALIQHGALVSSAMAHGPAMMMDSNTRSLQFAASTFDVSITEILSCLILGGCVCVPSEEARLNAIEEAITQLQANWALLTPTFVKFINPDDVPCLKTLVTGGEAMTQAIIRSWSHINLINCYGPAETSVVSHVHRGMRQGKNPLNIGHQVGIHCWVVDRYDHDRLMPVGAVGELIIEGHTLAREYYREPDKTADVFIYDPEWTKHQPPEPTPRRMYKTGDLVKYNHDGTFHIAGRKDTQIKFHGQRIELGEIEHHLNVSPSIKHGMVVLPKEGFCSGRLLTIIQLSDALNQDLVPKGRPYKLIDGELEETAKVKIAEAKQLLTERLPPYMVPSMWLAVEFIPRLQSGKLDRKQTAKWIDEMSEDLYRQLNPVAATGSSEDMTFASEIELELHKIWSHVLNLNSEQLGLHQSFLSVGGDSISAMQVMSECRKRGLGLTVSHIIGSKSISILATHVKDIETPLFHQEILEQDFDLSPIQKLYFSRPNHSRGHYNQSFLLKTSQRILASDMAKAIEAVVQRHSMLRARFSQNSEGVWQQRLTNEVASSYRLRTVKLSSSEEIDHALDDSQTCLSATDGPLFAADLIDMNGEEELLFVVAHHLIIDLVSWRVILQELEELLVRPDLVLGTDRPLPFQTWSKLQREHAETLSPQQVLPVEGIPDGDAKYWGMEDTPNVYGQMAREGFEIGQSLTSLLLSKCHESLRTEIPDILLAAMIYSFAQTFTDRSVPAVFAEGHGRESWDPSLDLSNVIGWFTTIYPVFAASNAQTSLVDTVKLVKDSRRKVLDNGRPYFASRWLTQAGKDAFESHWPLEITFNYLGQYQQLEREGALFTPARDIAGEVRDATEGADVGPQTTCISFFEVSAVILKGSLRFSFVFNKNMNHQPKIREWIASCKDSLVGMVEQLSARAPEPTLSDFPLLSLTYDRLDLMVDTKLPQAGVKSVDLVEDVYPCSPMQSGLLVSTTKNSAFYAAYTLHEVKSRTNQLVDAKRLAGAWERLVRYHPMLRTIFIESVAQQDSLYDQVVLKEVEIPMIQSQRDTDEEAIAALGAPPLHQEDNSQLLHRFEIVTSSTGKVFCRLDISHVIMDGTSLSIVFRDLAYAYEGTLKAEEGPLYRDYIKHYVGQAIQPGIDYWSSYLSGIEPCHFPVLNDETAVESKELRYVKVKFEELTDLQKLCDDRGVTIVNAIYAAWALTLRLYTASEEVCFGYLTSARDSPIQGIRDVVGPVINMIVCRVNVTDSITLGEMMSVVQKDYLDSLAYRHIPLAEVQHALQLSNTALFNTALSYRKLPPAEKNPPDVMFEECRPTYDPDEYNVSINIEAGDKDMAIDLMYWTDTLSDGQAANVASTFTKTLGNILHHANKPVAQLEHLGPWNMQQLSKWNGQMPAAIEACVHDLFKKEVVRRPTAPAIASWDMNFTYAELDEVSTTLAHHLMSLGVGPEVFVLVCFEKSAATIVAMLAILKAGGACVPLDPAHPDAALQLRADDTGAKIALVTPSLAPRLSKIVQQTVGIDSDFLQRLVKPSKFSPPKITPHNACFVIYTSGSTGKPKGVVLEHRGIATNAEYSGYSLGYEENSRVLQFASYTFDNSLAEIFTTLTRGGCVCVPSNHERLNDLAGVINRLQVTFVDITPTVACFLQPSDVPTLKIMALGGEAVTVKCVEIWKDFVSLHCCYGPSECSVNSTYSGDIAQPGKAQNIGRAIGSVAWVVDANDHNCLLPVGCTGELIIDGPIVSRGYLNLPEKTKESFISPPRWLEAICPGGNADRHLYKTGDLVRYDSDGTLMYLGRKDTQVKLNGQRIELGEIEHHIEGILPEGTQSAVELIVSDGKKSLACFVCADADSAVPNSGDESDILPMTDSFRMQAKDVEIALATKIPAYMVPVVWLPITKMPLTSSGKLNRRGLRLQAQALPPSLLVSYKLATKSGRAPSSVFEKHLADIWATVLNIDPASIGIEDNFFKLGGDSISAMRLVTLARKSDINLTVGSIFQKASLLDMAQSAMPMSNHTVTAAQPFSLLSTVPSVDALRQEVARFAGIKVETIEDIYPCTNFQEGLMSLSIKEPGAYVAQFIYSLPEDVDTARFMEAWNFVIKTEPTLRTRIVHLEDFGFLQVVVDEATRWSSPASLADVNESERHLPSHNGGKLTNYAIAGAGSSAASFVWTIHHALYDGWCLPIILDKVKQCYQGMSSVQVVGPSYASFIKYTQELDLEETDDFWRNNLSNISAQQFPRLPNPDHQANASSLLIHRAPFNRQQRSEITIATRIRAAWALTVSAYSAADDVVFWETVTGRDAPVPGIEEMVGATLATVPRRMQLTSSLTLAKFLRTIQDDSAAAMSHQYAGIQRIKRLNADTALACGAQNLIAINNGARDSADPFWVEKTNEMEGTNFYTYPLMLSCHIEDQDIETVVHFDEQIISKLQMQRVMDHFAFMVASVTSADLGNEDLGNMTMISLPDRKTLQSWNHMMPAPVDRLVFDMINDQAVRQDRNKLAIRSWDCDLTYTELDVLSSRLASVLIDNGIKCTSMIPFCMEKSSLVVVSMLAIMKAGAAFVPLDPAYPDARVKGILEDVEATVVLCSPQYEGRFASFGPNAISVTHELVHSVSLGAQRLPDLSTSSPAYVIFTSGTTGKPKGTVVGHAAFCTGASAHGAAMGMNKSSRVLQFASYTFDASIMEILTALIKGGTVCIPSDEERMNNIAGAINRMDVNWTLLTPSVAQLIQPSSVPGLRTIVLGGEAMSAAHIAQWGSSNVKLMNAYGPSETSVVAAVNPVVTPATGPANIGHAVGGHCWVTDANNHDRLVPIGAIGELVVEGHILAQGYLKNPQKTAESFISNPRWCDALPGPDNVAERRMYKTGDLVKLADDGTIIFQGRKDNQVKLNGQRMELSEVEHHLGADPVVKHGMVAIPSTGPCKKRLVAILSLDALSDANQEAGNVGLQLVKNPASTSYLTSIQERLVAHLAAYMVPSKWIVVDSIPLLPSGKLDRRRVITWVEGMTAEDHQDILKSEDKASALDREATEVEQKIRAACAKVLNLDEDKIPFKQSFLHLGGDSISAMQLLAVCRSSNVAVTVSRIMQSKSIVELATHATAVEDVVYEAERENEAFDLSPIQKVYFNCLNAGSTHFNQSMLLGTNRTVSIQELSKALEAVIETHSMLRARFSLSGKTWSQRITDEVVGSYSLRHHTDVERSSLSGLIRESQKSLDIVNGPLFAADVFELEGTYQQVVTFVAHHLIIDVVSWNIILQDLEGMLSPGPYKLTKPLSFQTWNALQNEQAQQASPSQVFHDLQVPSNNFSYWGMQELQNLHGDAITKTLEVDAEHTQSLLGPAHEAYQTDIVDIMLASLLISFQRTFSDRSSIPAIFNEGHGREPWDDKLDLSRTIGWFTTLLPVFLPENMTKDADIVDVVRWIKDFRRKIPGKGRPYFAHRQLSKQDQAKAQDLPVEIAFNFLGQTQQIDRSDSVFKTLDGSSMDSTNAETDIGANVPRLALIEISASIVDGRLSFGFSFNRNMDRQDSIHTWITACGASVRQAAQKLSSATPEPTMSDFSLLPLTFKGVSQIKEKLAETSIGSLDNIETAYPCSPVQQGILLTQIKDPEYYSYSAKFEVKCSNSGEDLDPERLANAWQAVVDRHSTLRTVFVGSLLEEGTMDQVVLKNYHAQITTTSASVDGDACEVFTTASPLGMSNDCPPHHLTISKTSSGRVFCMLEMSHAIADGTSMPILFRDLALAYAGALPNLRLSVYESYIAHLQQRQGVSGAEYWKTLLSGVEPCYFPTLTDGVAAPKVLRALDQEISHARELQTFCTENGVTLSNVLQMAWAIVLQAYTGLDDVCFGYLVAGRDLPVDNLDQAIGVFINMLICRVQLSPSTALGDVLAKVQEDLTESMEHKQISLAEIQHEIGTSNTPLFNTAYSFQRRSVSKSLATGPISFDISDAQDPSEYDITVNVEVWDSSAELQLCYWTDKISDSQAKNIASTYNQVLSSIVSHDSEAPIGELNLLSEHCSQQLAFWNTSEPEFLEECVHQVFERNAKQQPDGAPAIQAWDASFTYNELDAVSSRLAEHLVHLGVKPETYVPFCFEKSAWTVVSMMAVLKAGGAFVPLDPTHPPERISFLIHSVDAKVVLCSSSLTAKFDDVDVHTLAVSEQTVSQLPEVPQNSAVVRATPSNPAYIIFTSGTTGLPKGTIIEHGAFTTGGTAHAKAIKMKSTSRVLQFASHTFDASIMEILSTLLVGGCICIPSDQERMNDLAAAINKFNINWTLLTPSVVNVLKPGSVPGLKVLVTGGEAMSRDHITKWSGEAALVNAYGPSETSVIAATHTKVDEDGTILNDQPATIGHGVGSRSWVIDPRNHNRLMPIGSIGELLVEGPIVARGYLNNEAKTRDAFIEHPSWRSNMKLAGNRTDRMYKTGDLVVYNTDGSINYVARKDTQIKLNGQRIELGEIEHHVKANLPEDCQSVVDLVIPQSKAGTKALAVFFTPAEATEVEDVSDVADILLPMSSHAIDLAKSLKTALGGVLPSYMIPTIYIPITKMPWTLAGKLDRQRLKSIVPGITLPQLAPYKLAGSIQKRSPTTLMQRKLQKAWGKILSLEEDTISNDDSFFRLGGDSVGAMKLVAAARVEDVVLTVMNIFRHPTLSDMATFCGAAGTACVTAVKALSLLQDVDSPTALVEEMAECCDIEKSQIQDVYPCTSLQEGLVTSSLQQPGAYVAKNVFKLTKGINVERFKLAWQKTVDQVDILRSRIVNAQSSKSYQVVLQPQFISWNVADDLQHAMNANHNVPEKNGATLSKYTLTEPTTSGSRYFVWTVHHALYDAWSMPSILKMVEQFYIQDSAASPIHSVPFANFIKYLSEVDVSASNNFWEGRFKGASPSHFPPIPTNPSTAERATTTINHAIKYDRSSLKLDVTVPTIVRAAWALVIGSQTGSDDMVFGETLSGRDVALPGVSDIIGPTLTTVPTRVVVDRDAKVRDFLSNIHEQAAEVIPYQHAGLQNLKRLGGAMALACDFQHLLVVQSGEGSEGQEQVMLPVEGDDEHGGFFTYPLVVECTIEAKNLTLTIHHDDTVIGGWQVDRIVHQFASLVQQLIAISPKSNTKVADLRMCSQEDVEILKEWNQMPLMSLDESIPKLFFEVSARTPEITAIHAWDGQLTYDAVRQHATRLAKYLVSKGVGPETLVPCCMDKGLWTSVSMLAVSLAGGAVVPLDPAHPPARHAELVRDCDSRLVLSSPQHQERFQGVADIIVLVDNDLFDVVLPLAEVSAEDLPIVTSNHAAIVIFTSGSTGKPKGVVIEHGSFCTSTKGYMKRMNLTPASRVFHFTSYAFDISMGETFGALTSGACLCVPSEEMRVGDLAGAMNSLRATWAFLTPSVAKIQDPSQFTTLQTLVCGGEALTPETIETWADKVVLMNGYGPAECTIFAVANANVSQGKDHTHIGHAMDGGQTWVVDPRDHNQLVPLGCVGELLIGGAIVSRGYLNDKAKTEAAFIQKPKWTSWFTNGEEEQPMRLYKSGDLVKYRPDGTLTYIGRKDHQVKLHGQRMELGEIETRLEAHHHIRHSLVNLPKTGICKGRLVAVVSLRGRVRGLSPLKGSDFVPVSPISMEVARHQIMIIQDDLAETLPPYMVPSSWLIVESIPLLLSGKLDRKSAETWLSTLDVETYKAAVCADGSEDVVEPESEVEHLLRGVWSSILNLDEETTPTNRSFISLGGDSITAIQVMTRCRDHSIRLSLQEVIKSKSITELAELIEREDRQAVVDVAEVEDEVNQKFALSPIQQLFFNNSRNKEQGDRFNQSQLLTVRRSVDVSKLELAIQAIVQRHSMLRSRFTKSNSGKWSQLIAADVESSYSFRSRKVTTDSAMIPFIADSQNNIDVSGPLFIADLFEKPDGRQVLSLIAHHLVIDIVSWFSVIHDLETFIVQASPNLSNPFSFQAWTAAQAEHAKSLEKRGEAALPFAIQPAKMDFWGMAPGSNVYGDVTRKSFIVSDIDVVNSAMHDCHMPLRSEPLDLFIAVLLQSFAQTFADREMPTLFNEGHGRETWDHTIDISQTVGWFTALCPIHISLDDGEDGVDSVRRVKDARRSIPSNGRPYFAHRYLTESGKRTLADHEPMEIVLNYLGQTQKTSNNKSLLEPMDMPLTDEEQALVSDVAPNTHRLALFEVSVSVLDEGIAFNFMYNKNMLHQDRIGAWIDNCEMAFVETVRSLSEAPLLPTLSDVPMLPVNYSELHQLINKNLPAVDVHDLSEVEDIYPCSPMQTGILLSQLRDPGSYLFHTVLEVTAGKSPVDVEKLSEACLQTIDRHPAMRTVFVNSVYRGGTFDQVVLRPLEHRIKLIKAREIEVMAKLNARSLKKTNKASGPKLPYQITICHTPQGKVFIKLEMNHAITDGASTSIIMQDISRAYKGSLPSTDAPTYKEYIKYLSSHSMDDSLKFWTSYLTGAQTTNFPAMNRGSGVKEKAKKSLGSVFVNFDRFSELHSLSSDSGVTFSNMILAAWALVLRSYTNTEDVCFGYLASGRDAGVDNIENIVGLFINMLVFRFRFAPGMLLKDLFQDVHEDYLDSLPHQHFSLARVNNALGRRNNKGFFNTAVSIQSAGTTADAASDELAFESVEAHDPSEYAVTLNVNTTRGDEGIMFRYWTDTLSDDQAEELSTVMSDLLSDFIDHSEEGLSHLRLFQRAPPVQTCPQTPDLADYASSHEDDLNYKTASKSSLSSKTSVDMNSVSSIKTKMPSASGRMQELLANKLMALWRETLDLDDCAVSSEDSFFELGGDSIIAMSMVGNAREADMSLTVADIFKNPTFGDMLQCLLERSVEEYAPSLSDGDGGFSKKEVAHVDEDVYTPFSLLKQDNVEEFIRTHVCPVANVSRASILDVLPTTDFQAQAIEGGLLNSRWNINYFYLDGSGELDMKLLQESIANVVASFDILRTVFVPHGKGYLQAVLRQIQPYLSVHHVGDLEEFTEDLKLAHLQEAPKMGRSHVRFTVAHQHGSDRHRIFLRLSHAQYDGVCFPAILSALQTCYEGGSIDSAPSYAKYIQGSLGKVTSEHYEYWSKLLEGSTSTDVVPRSYKSLKTVPTQVLKQVVPMSSLASLNITPATIVKAAWSIVLAKATGKSDVVFGHLISGRNVASVQGIESIVGPCINVVPVRVQHQSSWTVLDLLKYIQDQQVDNMPYESLGFQEIIDKCSGWADNRGGNGFSTFVQHQSMPQTGDLSIGGNKYNIGVIGSDEDTADLSVITTPQEGDKLEVCFMYANDGTIAPAFAEEMSNSLCQAITSFSEDPNAPVII